MNKIVDFNGIGYVAATFPVDSATQTYLKENYLDASTGDVDINGKNLAVKLGEDGTVGFGASAPTATDALLGVIVAYEMDGFASVQVAGGIDEVPTSAAIKSGRKGLAVNNKGEVVAVDGARETTVAKQSTTDNLFTSIIL
jgi:hypothetical protein